MEFAMVTLRQVSGFTLRHEQKKIRTFMMKRSFFLAIVSLLFAGHLSIGAAKAADIVIGVPSWSSARATAHVLGEIIKEKFGVSVDYKDATNEEIFAAMDRGDMQIHPEVWLPNHRDLNREYVDVRKTVAMSKRGVPATQGMCVTAETASKYGITSITDLTDPEKAKVFDTNSDGSGEVWIGDKEWASTRIEKIRAKSYGYAKTMTLLEGQETVALAMIDVAAATGKPLVFYCYEPHHLFGLHEVVFLKEPPHDVGKWHVVSPSEDPQWLEHSNAAVAWDISFLHIHYQRALEQSRPDIAKFLSAVELDTDTISDMTYALVVERRDPADYAKEWVKENESRIAVWLK